MSNPGALTRQKKFKKNLVDMGGKLGEGKLVTEGSAADGPFIEVKELVGATSTAGSSRRWHGASGCSTSRASRMPFRPP